MTQIGEELEEIEVNPVRLPEVAPEPVPEIAPAQPAPVQPVRELIPA